MRRKKLGLIATICVLCAGLTAPAFGADFFGQRTTYRDALSEFVIESECLSGTLTINLGSYTTHNIGQPPVSGESVYVDYVVQDLCWSAGMRMFGGGGSFEHPVKLKPNLERAHIDLELELPGIDCIASQEGPGYECSERSFLLVATVRWQGVGEPEHSVGEHKDPKNGNLLSRYESTYRQAEATIEGLLDGEVIDLITTEARFADIKSKVLTLNGN